MKNVGGSEFYMLKMAISSQQKTPFVNVHTK